MRIDDEPAFILHARAWRETSLLVEAFTRAHGRVGLVARGVRGPRSRLARSSLQPLQPLLLGWSARGELGTLTSAEPSGTQWLMSGDALFAGMYVNELVLRLTSRNDAHPAAFAAYAECLDRLADGADIAWTLRRFERDLLADLGYALMLARTADDEAIEVDRLYAYVADAGPVAWKENSQLAHVRGAALLALDRDEAPTPPDLVDLRRVMRGVIRHWVGGELNAWALASRRWIDQARAKREDDGAAESRDFV